MNLAKNLKFSRVSNTVAAGTVASNSGIIDMQDFEGVVGVLSANTITDGAFGLKAQGGNLPDGSDMADLAGTFTALQVTDDNKLAILDVYRCTYRYIRFVTVRGGATGGISDGVVAIQYGPRTHPTVQDAATVGNSVLAISPAYGVA